MSLDDFERYPLLFGPSPVHPLDRLSDHLGGARIWAKREDCNSGLAFGGNKTRKLEFLVAEALAQGADTLITVGAVQSNHCRLTLGAAARDAGREISLYHGALPEASSAALAAQLLGRLTTPSQAAIRAERKIRLQEALNSLDPTDREVLALRHFEELSNTEAAAVLGLDKSAASKRYARALIRLKEILASMPGGLDEV